MRRIPRTLPPLISERKCEGVVLRKECLTCPFPEVISKRASKRRGSQVISQIRERIENCNYLGSIHSATFSHLNPEELGPIK